MTSITGIGTTFNGFASVDGETWTKLGTAIITMPNTVYLGFTVYNDVIGYQAYEDRLDQLFAKRK